MSWDIYGEPLRRGHCEVHPHVHEEYPCSVCIADKRSSEQQVRYRSDCESEHLLSLQQEHIEHLEQECEALAAHVERLREALMNIDADLEGRNFLERSRLRDTARSALKVEPGASLARLKAKWQAEALEQLAADSFVFDADELRDRASELRRQAEGGER